MEDPDNKEAELFEVACARNGGFNRDGGALNFKDDFFREPNNVSYMAWE
jgi:hypothetical protein